MASRLTYEVLPARQGGVPHPGLLLLHGRGTDEHDLLPLAAELDPRLVTVAARAPFDFPLGGYMWYELDPRGVGYPDAASLNHSLELLRELIDEMVAIHHVDPEHLYAGGFSMGAAMAGTLALTDPDKVAGAAILSGYLPLAAGLLFRPQEAVGHSFFQAHGTLDPVIPILWGRQTRAFLAKAPVALTYQEYLMGHQTSIPELRDLSTWFGDVLAAAGWEQPAEERT